MSLSKALKRKVDSEGRTYKEEWKEKYAFILPEFINAKPVCLICNEVVAVCKEYNIRRHHDTKHGTFKVAYPLQTGTRRHKLEALTASYAHSSKILVRGLTAQQKVTSASLKAAWVLARHNRPFTDAEIFKEVMVAVLEELATDKSMDGVIASVKQVPLSARSATRRIDALSDAVHGVIFSGLSQANYFSLAIDESTDNTDVSQMCVYVRYFDGKEFREELLSLIPLEGNTTGEIIFNKLEEVFRLHSLSFEKINLIVTDGAPAMLGKHRGLVSRLKEIAPQTHGLHCLIHQSVLCARLSGELKGVMDKVMRIINFIRGTSSTQHRLFRQLVSESEDATHDDLLLHNDVRWLSKGKALERFCALLDEVKAFLRLSKMRAADDHLAFLQDEMSMSNVAFLTDIFGHLNQLNLQLQGRGKTIVDMVEKMESFTRKLELFHSDLSTGRLLHFTTLKSQVRGEVTGLMVDFIKQLRANFKSRFDDYSIPRDIVAFVRDPLTVRSADFSSLAKETIPLLDEAAFQMELIDFQATSLVSDALKSAQSVDYFWMTCSDEYSWIKKLAFYVLTMFPSTYTCESAFSSMNAIKTQERNRLTHKNLENCLRVKVTSISPDIQKIVKNEAPAEVQITAEQLLREAKERELELLPPKQEITVKEELNDSKLRKRKINLLPGSVILKQTPQFSVLTSR
ncbi:protein FAM200A-like [Cololabis saira]|uniref:protein FAM200A-like n=1 Tax=Cololabis saira TaxID=129043 RepID=UPI002AD278ED|nr:protein FAM200A-like [Cololabis saira]